MNLGDIISIVGAVISAVTVIVVVATFTRNGKKDTEDEGKATGTILTELGYIKGGIDDVKTEQSFIFLRVCLNFARSDSKIKTGKKTKRKSKDVMIIFYYRKIYKST